MENKKIPSYPEPLPPPPPRYAYTCSDLLANLLENLRHYQKKFFASSPGTLERQTALQESKRLERELDQFLKKRKEEKERLPDLFSP